MFRITRLTIEKFRNVEPTELELGPGFVLLLGKNGTGKTTLLELLAGVAQGAMRSLPTEQFSSKMSWQLDTPDGTKAEFGVEGSSRSNDLIRTSVIGPAGRAHAASIHTRRPECLRKAFGDPLPSNIQAAFLQPDRYIHGGRFDEALDFLWHIARRGLTDEGASVTELGDEGRASSSVTWDFIGHEDLVRAATRNEPQLSWDDTSSYALRDLPGLLRVSRVSASMTRLQVVATDEGRRHFYSLPSFEFHLPDGTSFLHDRLSFGQKRLLAFVHYMEALHGRPAVCDELANGFHYDWIAYAFEKLSTQQAFLSSQNPVLLDRVNGLESVEDVRRAFITCRMKEEKSGARRLVWKNATEEEAEAFLRGYRTGIAHVSEVLRDKELW
jgi:energy-coupling factor transporter ATP-binding protein EcfA2